MASSILFYNSLFVSVVFSFFVGLLCAQEDNRDSRNVLQEGSSNFFYQVPLYPRDCKDVLQQCSSSRSNGVYFIKPDGYIDPFPVYCDHEVDSGGWTVVSRRDHSSFVFNRNWEKYKTGFGFLSSNFWLGNEKISYLTNQDVYELRIDMVLSNGLSFYIKYDSYRTSDEWGEFALLDTGTFEGNTSGVISECPLNTVYGNCSCQPSCEKPNAAARCHISCEEPEGCVCEGGFLRKGTECVSPNECECFITEINAVIPNNGIYINADCSTSCTCENSVLSCNLNYECSPNAMCKEEEGFRRCYCNVGYEGDGEICNALYTDCYDAYQAGSRADGVYTIFPTGWQGTPFNVSCDMTKSGGGWTLFQRRTDGITNFTRNWENYKHGFGSLEEGEDFWLGNEQMFYLTSQKSYKLRIDIIGSDGTSYFAEYSSFRIDDVNTNYRIVNIGTHSGNTGDGMDDMTGAVFSTYDRDNDGCSKYNCADRHGSGWWHNPLSYHWNNYIFSTNRCSVCYASSGTCRTFQYVSNCPKFCTTSNLNGVVGGTDGKNINWRYKFYCNPIFLEMKIRPAI